jgi:competence protein ComEC
MRLNSKYITVLVILIIANGISLVEKVLPHTNTNLEITFLDVGQGDSILIKTPENVYGLIDAGRNANVMTQLGKYLPQNQKNFEFVIMTHPDADHIEGFLPIFERYTIENLFLTRTAKHSALFKSLKEVIVDKNIKNYTLHSNNDFQIGDINFNIVWPAKSIDTFAISNTNESSISVLLKYRGYTMYSGGDLGIENEQKSLQNLDFEEMPVDILKAGHHGSKNSSSMEFLTKLKPKVTIFSAGKDNSYGHPHNEVLSRVEHISSKILRTDQNLSIKISTDGYTMQIIPELGESFILST